LSHHASKRFWQRFNELTPELQQLARDNYELLRADPQHSSLHFKRVKNYWSVRVGASHRALGVDSPKGILWFWIGKHDEYDRLIAS
jgi:hypothetical protein